MRYIAITGRNNDRIKHVCALLRSASARRECGQFVLEGLRLCRDAAVNGCRADSLFFTQKAFDKNAEDLALLSEHAQRAYLVSEDVFAKMSETDSSQGVLSVLPFLAEDEPAALNPCGRYVACENLSDPGNLGAIARTAEALGADGMLLFGHCCDRYNPKALRASMGALLRVPMLPCPKVEEGVAALKAAGLELYASVVDSRAEPIQRAGFHDGSVVFIGNEANGLSDTVTELSDRRITIPIRGRSESFNAAAAAAILLWELMKE